MTSLTLIFLSSISSAMYFFRLTTTPSWLMNLEMFLFLFSRLRYRSRSAMLLTRGLLYIIFLAIMLFYYS